jgi:hypothetical protein
MTPPQDESKRTIDDLTGLYSLEPALRDLFIEGRWDAKLIGKVLKYCKCPNVVAYEISSIHIPAPVVSKYSSRVDNKTRCVALAKELASVTGSCAQATCIVDTDLDRILGNYTTCEGLLTTDYCCMESYLLTEPVIEKFLDFVVRNCPVSAAEVLQIIRRPIEFMFMIRAARERFAPGMSLVKLKKYLTVTKDSVRIDEKAYLDSLLMSNGMLPRGAEFQNILDELKPVLSADIRESCHKKDMFVIFAEFLRQYDNGCGSGDPAVLERSLSGCFDLESLSREPLFQALIKRIS